MKKRMTREKNILAYTSVDNSKLVATGSLMVGNVGETNETIRETIDVIRKAHIGSSAVFFAAAYPGGRTWDWAVERGIITDTHAYLVAASDQDAASRINVNLTPFPDFILKAWQQMLIWESEKQERKKQDQLYSHSGLRQKAGLFMRRHFGRTYIPSPLLPFIVGLYFVYYRMTRKVYKTAKDRQYEYDTDSDGSLLPKNLLVSEPQRFVSPEKLQTLARAPKNTIRLIGIKNQ